MGGISFALACPKPRSYDAVMRRLTQLLSFALLAIPVAATAEVKPYLGQDSRQSAAPHITFDILSDTKGTQLNSYLRAFAPELQQSFSKSLGLRDAQSVGPQQVDLLLTIAPDGKLSALRLGSGTKDSPITKAAWEAVKNTQYTPLPSSLGGSDLKLRVHFVAN
jgi:hypothetical protein